MATHSNIPVWENSYLGQRSLEGYNPWGCKESNMTEQLTVIKYKILNKTQGTMDKVYDRKLVNILNQ